MINKNNRAFTLIELLTVIAVIGILAAIIIPTTGAVRTSAKKAQTKSQFSQIATAMTLFKQEYGYYPIIPNDKLNGDLAPDATTVSIKSRQMRMLELLTGRDADLATPAFFESSEDNLTAGTPRAQNRKRMSFYNPATAEILEFAADKKAFIDAFGNVEIVVLVDRNGDGVVSDDEPRDEDGDGDVETPSPKKFPKVYSTTDKNFFVDSQDIEDGKLTKVNATAFGVRANVVVYSAGPGKNALANKIPVTDATFSW